MLDTIQSSGMSTAEFVRKVKDKEDGVRLMGFGHRVYKNYDPRRTIPDGAASSLLQHFDVVSTFRFVSPLLDHLVGDWHAINGFHTTSVIRNTCLNVAEIVCVVS